MASKFSDFKIKTPTQSLVGDKIKVARILNREITVIDYRIEPSKYGDSGRCLYLQIEMNNTKHVVFTGSSPLIQQIEQVPREGFPFLTTIIKDDQRYEFT